MSDSITNCTVYKNPDGSVQYYEIDFLFDGFAVPFKGSIRANTLTDPNDLVELKTAACKQASAIKSLYVNSTVITDLNGLVTL
jgi:hypothetical protein